jgi:regulator of RNase E activity RraA
MNKIWKDVFSFIENNKLSTSDVADALGRKGNVKRIKSVNSGHYVVGKLQYLFSSSQSNWHTHKGLEGIENGNIAFVHDVDYSDKAICGHLMLSYALNYRKAKAVVVVGNIRDIERVIKENMPVWCVGTNPVVCSKTETVIPSYVKDYKEKYDNGIVVCDDTGVVVVTKEDMTDELMSKLEYVKNREEKWYKMLEEGKSTFEITCTTPE